MYLLQVEPEIQQEKERAFSTWKLKCSHVEIILCLVSMVETWDGGDSVAKVTHLANSFFSFDG